MGSRGRGRRPARRRRDREGVGSGQVERGRPSAPQRLAHRDLRLLARPAVRGLALCTRRLVAARSARPVVLPLGEPAEVVRGSRRAVRRRCGTTGRSRRAEAATRVRPVELDLRAVGLRVACEGDPDAVVVSRHRPRPHPRRCDGIGRRRQVERGRPSAPPGCADRDLRLLAWPAPRIRTLGPARLDATHRPRPVVLGERQPVEVMRRCPGRVGRHRGAALRAGRAEAIARVRLVELDPGAVGLRVARETHPDGVAVARHRTRRHRRRRYQRQEERRRPAAPRPGSGSLRRLLARRAPLGARIRRAARCVEATRPPRTVVPVLGQAVEVV